MRHLVLHPAIIALEIAVVAAGCNCEQSKRPPGQNVDSANMTSRTLPGSGLSIEDAWREACHDEGHPPLAFVCEATKPDEENDPKEHLFKQEFRVTKELYGACPQHVYFDDKGQYLGTKG